MINQRDIFPLIIFMQNIFNFIKFFLDFVQKIVNNAFVVKTKEL